ncbi:MAG: hypothetical protein ACP5US_03610 [Candidatus Kryptoniota bacterium]
MKTAEKNKISDILKILFEIIAHSGTDVEATPMIVKLERLSAETPSQFSAINNLERFLNSTPNQASVISDLNKNNKLLTDFIKIISTSQYLADILVQHPSFFRFLFSQGGIETIFSAAELHREMLGEIKLFSTRQHRLDYLRRIYKREILRIGARDICGYDDIESTTRQISDLADTILQVILEVSAADFTDKFHESPPALCVIGLGKLGGRELNYSSDIDLLFIYKEDNDKLTHSLGDHASWYVDNFMKYLTTTTNEGHLYRTDLRLRPDGASGPVVRTLQSALTYYESRGELWERQMLIKARHIAGDKYTSEIFLRTLVPFVYPRTWLENPLDEIARIKLRIEADSSDELNIKLRRGGIRDIEFIVQALQLLNGGTNPELRTGNTLKAIQLLCERKLLSRKEARVLDKAYRLFRLVEHRLQLYHNIQTHTIPPGGSELLSLAKRCGYRNERRFRNELFGYFQQVASIFDDVFHYEEPIQQTEIGQILDGLPNDQRTARALQNYGVLKPDESLKHIKYLSRGITRTGDVEFPTSVTRTFREIAPMLFEDLKLTPDPDLALHNLARMVPVVKSVEAFYKSLFDERVRRLILTISSRATKFISYISSNPLMLDLILTAEHFLDPKPYLEEMPASSIRAFNEMKYGLLYLLGEISLEEMQRLWTNFAEQMLLREYRRIFREDELILIAGGKLGTGEMSFFSDLDLFALSPNSGRLKIPELEKRIQELQRNLVDEDGQPLFEIDFKLRPEGRSAPLIVSLEEYKKYLQSRVSIWELMAMTGFRVIVNDTSSEIPVKERLLKFEFTEENLKEIIKIHEKTVQTKKIFGTKDVKTSDGGMVTIQFISQILILSSIEKFLPAIPMSIPDALRTATNYGLIDTETAEDLINNYNFYRMIEFVNYTALSRPTHKLPDNDKDLNTLASNLDYKNTNEFLNSVSSRLRWTASTFRKVVSQFVPNAH